MQRACTIWSSVVCPAIQYISTLSHERNCFWGEKHHHNVLRDRWAQNLGCHEYDLVRRVTTIVNWTRLGRAKTVLGHIRGQSTPGTFLKRCVGDWTGKSYFKLLARTSNLRFLTRRK